MELPWEYSIGFGCFELSTLRDRRSRLELIRGLSAVESGKHTEDVELARTEAFRVEPAVREGIFSIDGERFPVEPFQAQVLKQVGRKTSRVPLSCHRFHMRICDAISSLAYCTIFTRNIFTRHVYYLRGDSHTLMQDNSVSP